MIEKMWFPCLFNHYPLTCIRTETDLNWVHTEYNSVNSQTKSQTGKWFLLDKLTICTMSLMLLYRSHLNFSYWIQFTDQKIKQVCDFLTKLIVKSFHVVIYKSPESVWWPFAIRLCLSVIYPSVSVRHLSVQSVPSLLSISAVPLSCFGRVKNQQ